MTTHTNDCSSCDFRIAKVPAQAHEDGAVHDVVLAAFDYPRYGECFEGFGRGLLV
jgi:hypothetical protein